MYSGLCIHNLYNHHHLISEYLHHPCKNLCTSIPYFPYTVATTNYFLSQICLFWATLWTTIKGGLCFWLLSLSTMFSKSSFFFFNLTIYHGFNIAYVEHWNLLEMGLCGHLARWGPPLHFIRVLQLYPCSLLKTRSNVWYLTVALFRCHPICSYLNSQELNTSTVAVKKKTEINISNSDICRNKFC